MQRCRWCLWNRDQKSTVGSRKYNRDFLVMSLRTKLLLSYLIFIAALVVLGGWSAWRLRDMGSVSRRIISNNYDSVVAAQEMKESLERQDSAALFGLLGAHDKPWSNSVNTELALIPTFKRQQTI